MDDDKIIAIETKLAHQEHLVAALDEALTNQQVQIGKLEDLCQSLVERIQALSEAGGGERDDEPPPHY